jgi:RimJ/RimL family protein N-acetyltransferase
MNLRMRKVEVYLRPVNEGEDAALLNEIRNDPEVQKFLKNKGPEELKKTKELIRLMNTQNESKEAVHAGIILKKEEKLIGYIGLWKIDWENETGQLGYLLHKNYWNMGFMKKSLQNFLTIIKNNIKVKKIEAVVHNDNIYSIRLLRANRFNKSGKDENPEFQVYLKLLRKTK